MCAATPLLWAKQAWHKLGVEALHTQGARDSAITPHTSWPSSHKDVMGPRAMTSCLETGGRSIGSPMSLLPNWKSLNEEGGGLPAGAGAPTSPCPGLLCICPQHVPGLPASVCRFLCSHTWTPHASCSGLHRTPKFLGGPRVAFPGNNRTLPSLTLGVHTPVHPQPGQSQLTLHDSITGVQLTLALDAAEPGDLPIVFLLPDGGVYLIPWGHGGRGLYVRADTPWVFLPASHWLGSPPTHPWSPCWRAALPSNRTKEFSSGLKGA